MKKPGDLLMFRALLGDGSFEELQDAERNAFDKGRAERKAFQERIKKGDTDWFLTSELNGTIPYCPRCTTEKDAKGNETKGVPRHPLVKLGRGFQQGYARFVPCPECGITFREAYGERH